MIIRKAKISDLNSINILDRESIEVHKKFDPDFFTISEKFWNGKMDSQIKAMKSSINRIFVCEFDSIIVGYVWGYTKKLTKYKIGVIQELIVTSKHRKKGIGQKLIAEMIKFFKESKCVISEIEVLVDNLGALRTYEKMGFKMREHKLWMKLNSKKFKPFS